MLIRRGILRVLFFYSLVASLSTTAVAQEESALSWVQTGTISVFPDTEQCPWPYDMALDPRYNLLYVTNLHGSNIAIIDCNTLEKIYCIDVDPIAKELYPHIVFSSYDGMFYLSSGATGKLYKLDPLARKVVRTVDLNGSPYSITANSDGKNTADRHPRHAWKRR